MKYSNWNTHMYRYLWSYFWKQKVPTMQLLFLAVATVSCTLLSAGAVKPYRDWAIENGVTFHPNCRSVAMEALVELMTTTADILQRSVSICATRQDGWGSKGEGFCHAHGGDCQISWHACYFQIRPKTTESSHRRLALRCLSCMSTLSWRRNQMGFSARSVATYKFSSTLLWPEEDIELLKGVKYTRKRRTCCTNKRGACRSWTSSHHGSN